MEKVQKKEGFLCICAECKKVIKSIGTVTDNDQALVSHGICPECAHKLYGEFFAKKA